MVLVAIGVAAAVCAACVALLVVFGRGGDATAPARLIPDWSLAMVRASRFLGLMTFALAAGSSADAELHDLREQERGGKQELAA